MIAVNWPRGIVKSRPCRISTVRGAVADGFAEIANGDHLRSSGGGSTHQLDLLCVRQGRAAALSFGILDE